MPIIAASAKPRHRFARVGTVTVNQARQMVYLRKSARVFFTPAAYVSMDRSLVGAMILSIRQVRQTARLPKLIRVKITLVHCALTVRQSAGVEMKKKTAI